MQTKDIIMFFCIGSNMSLEERMNQYLNELGYLADHMSEEEVVQGFEAWLITDIYKRNPSRRKLIEMMVKTHDC